MNLPIIPTIKSVTDLRYQTAEIINLVNQGQPIVITRDSDSVAVIFSPKQYQQLVDLVIEIEDKKDSLDLEQAIKEGENFTGISQFDKKIRRKLERK